MQIRRLGEQTCDCRFAGAGRTPENKRTQRARCQHTRERTIRSEQMILANDLIELLWPELVGEWTRRVLVEACRGKQAWAARFCTRGHHDDSRASDAAQRVAKHCAQDTILCNSALIR